MTNNNKTQRLFYMVIASLFLLCVVAGAVAKVSAPNKFKSKADDLGEDVPSNQGEVPGMTIAQAFDRKGHGKCENPYIERESLEEKENLGPVGTLFHAVLPIRFNLGHAELRDSWDGPASAYSYLNSVYSPTSLLTSSKEELMFAKAGYAWQAGYCREAEKLYRMLIAENEKEAKYYAAMGDFLAERTERSAEALLFLEKALELSPQHPAIMSSISRALHKQDRLEEALEKSSEAVSLMEKSPYTEVQEMQFQIGILVQHGDLLWDMDRKQDAISFWCDAMRKDLPNIEKIQTLSKYLSRQGLNNIPC